MQPGIICLFIGWGCRPLIASISFSRSSVKSSLSLRWESNDTTATRSPGVSDASMWIALNFIGIIPESLMDSKSAWKK